MLQAAEFSPVWHPLLMAEGIPMNTHHVLGALVLLVSSASSLAVETTGIPQDQVKERNAFIADLMKKMTLMKRLVS